MEESISMAKRERPWEVVAKRVYTVILLSRCLAQGRLRKHVHIRSSLHPATLHVTIACVVVETHSCVDDKSLNLNEG